MKIIALEEHFLLPEISAAWHAADPQWQDLVLHFSADTERGRRLLDFGPDRIAAMDDAGIDVQVLSLTTPGVQTLDAGEAVALAKLSNDRVAAAIATTPDRFQGFATLPTPDPSAAAQELERAVSTLHLQGAMVFGRTRDRNFDNADFWPIFEAASALQAPLYMHPQAPQKGVRDAYYSGFSEVVDALFARPGLGWHYEAGMQILRMAVAGVFERFPGLRIITGHLGEVILFYLERIDMLSQAAKLPRKLSEYIQQHVYVTPSGLYSQRYLRWAIEVLGADHILMSTDYPYQMGPSGSARTFLQQAGLTEEAQNSIASVNWERMVAGIQR